MKKFIQVLIMICVVLSSTFVFSGCSRTSYEYADADKYSYGGTTLNIASVKNVSIDWVEGIVKLEYNANVRGITIEEQCETNLGKDEQVAYYFDGETLFIKYRKSTDRKVKMKKEKYLTISFPSQLSISSNIVCNMNNANLIVNGFKLSSINSVSYDGSVDVYNCFVSTGNSIVTYGGDVNLRNSTFADLSVDSKEGGIYTDKLSCYNLDVNTVSGGCVFNCDYLTNSNINVFSNNGDVTFVFNEKNIEEFSLKYVTMIGFLDSEFPLEEGEDLTYNYNLQTNHPPFISVETIGGRLYIKKSN